MEGNTVVTSTPSLEGVRGMSSTPLKEEALMSEVRLNVVAPPQPGVRIPLTQVDADIDTSEGNVDAASPCSAAYNGTGRE